MDKDISTLAIGIAGAFGKLLLEGAVENVIPGQHHARRIAVPVDQADLVGADGTVSGRDLARLRW